MHLSACICFGAIQSNAVAHPSANCAHAALTAASVTYNSLPGGNLTKHTHVLAIAAAVLFGATSAQAQRGRGDQHPPQAPQRGGGRGAVSQQDQQKRIDEEKKRQTDYQKKLNDQVHAAQTHATQLQSQKRTAQYQQHEQYLKNLQEQQQHLQASRDVAHDPYITAPANFRYRFNGNTRETNQYGADLLRQAVSDGYQQGYAAGAADRRDHARSNYQGAFGYQDANYGYNGSYVPESDYNYYFREGFRRGYQDGFGNRAQYGTIANGNASILGNILTSILGLTSIQ
jgi:hypothetical protein